MALCVLFLSSKVFCSSPPLLPLKEQASSAHSLPGRTRAGSRTSQKACLLTVTSLPHPPLPAQPPQSDFHPHAPRRLCEGHR